MARLITDVSRRGGGLLVAVGADDSVPDRASVQQLGWRVDGTIGPGVGSIAVFLDLRGTAGWLSIRACNGRDEAYRARHVPLMSRWNAALAGFSHLLCGV